MRAIWMSTLLALAACGRGGSAADEAHTGPGSGDPPTAAGDPHAGHSAATATAHEEALPEGLAEVAVAPDRQQLLGLRVARAERATASGVIRASAIVRPDETREAHVHSKIMGWVEKLDVNAVGQQVRRGEPLFSLYSQELFVAQQEYLRARKLNPDLAAAARERLRLWDIPDDQVALIEEKGPQRALVVRAPISGTVLEKNVIRGAYIEPDMMLYRIADLSRVWVVADVYEFEVARLDRKGVASFLVQGETAPRSARLDYVYPIVDAVSRTVKVRLVADNPRGELRPGSFATAELPTAAAEAVWVPEEAVIDTGVRQVVYVHLGEGRFRPVMVKVGHRADGRAEIRAGLEAGTEVVVSAQFLLDSESRLRGSAGPAGHGGH